MNRNFLVNKIHVVAFCPVWDPKQLRFTILPNYQTIYGIGTGEGASIPQIYWNGY